MLGQVQLARTMIVAPHPDDDVIGAAGLMQHVLAAGGDLRVVFVTDGENNPWPQRFLQRKIFLKGSDRAAWGAMRRREALCSLALLGVREHAALFLAYPDQGLGEMARRNDMRLRDTLQAAMAEFQPTLIVSPSSFDLHSDHRAIALFTHRAAPDAAIVTYAVHGTTPAERMAFRVELSERERRRKREAIECHTSQLALSRARFLAHAGPTEWFGCAEHDCVGVDSAARERFMAFVHAARVVLGAHPAAPAPLGSGVQPAADVQDSAGDVPGLL